MLTISESDFETNSFEKDEVTNFIEKSNCLAVYGKGFLTFCHISSNQRKKKILKKFYASCFC